MESYECCAHGNFFLNNMFKNTTMPGQSILDCIVDDKVQCLITRCPTDLK